MEYLRFIPENCVGCRVCEDFCSDLFFNEKNAEKSRIRILERYGKYVALICNQCGDCIPLCPTDAIQRTVAGQIVIDKKECIGCLMCVAECPIDAMMYHYEGNVPFKCGGCGVCVDQCPTKALELVKEK
jgi:Fe-S-cluster-containing hydrogenase component 2